MYQGEHHVLTPQHILLAGATGLTGELLLDRLLNEPTIKRVLAPRANRWRLTRTWKTRWATRPYSAATERPGRYRLLLPGHHHQTGRLEEAFRAVDLDMVVAFAKRAREMGRGT
jgi:uncharacterized protein YbjT (DUF2867 family)